MANSASLLRYASLPGLGSRSIPHQTGTRDEHLAPNSASVEFLFCNDNSTLPQRRVLLLGELEEYPASSHRDSLLQHQAALLVGDAAAALYQSDQLVRGFEVQSLGQESLQVGLKKLALPPMPVLEGQVHAVGLVLRGHGGSIGEDEAKIIHSLDSSE